LEKLMDFTLAIAIAPLLVGVFLTQLLRINLKGFVGVYLLLVAANVALSYLQLGGGFIAPLIIGVVGFAVLIVLTGIFGTRLRISDQALVAMGVGLFPWTLGLAPSITYGIIFAGLAIVIALRPKFHNPLRRRTYKR
jgi:hypothetical protein